MFVPCWRKKGLLTLVNHLEDSGTSGSVPSVPNHADAAPSAECGYQIARHSLSGPPKSWTRLRFLSGWGNISFVVFIEILRLKIICVDGGYGVDVRLLVWVKVQLVDSTGFFRAIIDNCLWGLNPALVVATLYFFAALVGVSKCGMQVAVYAVLAIVGPAPR